MPEEHEEKTPAPAQLAPVPKAREIALKASGALAPKTFEDAWRLAQAMASSSFVPNDYQGRPENCLIAMQMGAEIGLQPMQSVQNIAVINGRPSVWGDAALGIVIVHPLVKDVIEEPPTEENAWTARCTVYRRDRQPVSRTFSLQDATAADLVKKPGPWKNYRNRMIAMRARGFALRDSCADIMKGLAVVEDVMDIEDAVVISNTAAPSLGDLNEEIQKGPACAHDRTWTDPQGAEVCAECGEVLSTVRPYDREPSKAEAQAKAPPDPAPAGMPARPVSAEVVLQIKNAKTPDELAVAEDLIRELKRGSKGSNDAAAALADARRRLGIEE